MEARMKIMYSAQSYAISVEQLCKLTDAEPKPTQAYLHCMAKAAQQKLHYAVYSQVSNHFNEKVFMKSASPTLLGFTWN